MQSDFTPTVDSNAVDTFMTLVKNDIKSLRDNVTDGIKEERR